MRINPLLNHSIMTLCYLKLKKLYDKAGFLLKLENIYIKGALRCNANHAEHATTIIIITATFAVMPCQRSKKTICPTRMQTSSHCPMIITMNMTRSLSKDTKKLKYTDFRSII